MSRAYKAYPVIEVNRQGPPEYVPWEMLSPHEDQAWKNHGQSLARLAERGGLGWAEILAILEDKKWREIEKDGFVHNEAKAKSAVMNYVSLFLEGGRNE